MCRELFTCKPFRSQERPRVGGVCRELFTCKPFRSWERSPVSNVCLELLTCKLSGLGTGPGYKRVDGRPGREGGWRKACREASLRILAKSHHARHASNHLASTLTWLHASLTQWFLSPCGALHGSGALRSKENSSRNGGYNAGTMGSYPGHDAIEPTST